MRMEIDLPPSGLAKVNDSDVFPTPPKEISERGHDCHSTGASHSRLLPELEKSWGYYLSDIAVRQIGNRLMNTFYKEDESSWLTMPLDRVIRVAEEIDLQLTHWYVCNHNDTCEAYRMKGTKICQFPLLSTTRATSKISGTNYSVCSKSDCINSGSGFTVHSSTVRCTARKTIQSNEILDLTHNDASKHVWHRR